jgi:hypothetical protein
VLSVLVLAGAHRLGTSTTSENAVSIAQTSEFTMVTEHNANIVDDIEDLLEDLLDILDGNDPKVEPAEGD